MGNNPSTHSRAYREGWVGRRRTYHCRVCGEKYQVDTRGALPEKARICGACYLSSESAREQYRLAWGLEAVPA